MMGNGIISRQTTVEGGATQLWVDGTMVAASNGSASINNTGNGFGRTFF